MAAIYMWPVDDQILLTTTLYPVDAVEKLEISCAPLSGWLAPIPSESLETAHSVIDMSYVQARWYLEDGPYEDELETAHTVLDMTYVQTRWYLEDGPYDDELESAHTVLDMTYVRKKVEADSPDEGLQLAITIETTCTMDAI